MKEERIELFHKLVCFFYPPLYHLRGIFSRLNVCVPVSINTKDSMQM